MQELPKWRPNSVFAVSEGLTKRYLQILWTVANMNFTTGRSNQMIYVSSLPEIKWMAAAHSTWACLSKSVWKFSGVLKCSCWPHKCGSLRGKKNSLQYCSQRHWFPVNFIQKAYRLLSSNLNEEWCFKITQIAKFEILYMARHKVQKLSSYHCRNTTEMTTSCSFSPPGGRAVAQWLSIRFCAQKVLGSIHGIPM